MTALSRTYLGNPLPPTLRKRGRTMPLGSYTTARLKEWWKAAKSLARFFATAVVLMIVAVGLVVGFGHSHYAARAAHEDLKTIAELSERIDFVDSNGVTLGSIPWGTTRHCIKTLEEVPTHLVTALIHMEDRGFYEHSGVNWRGVGRAVKNDVGSLNLKEGGSGITQQLVKLWKWGIPRNEGVIDKFDRKFLEWHLASRVEQHYSKDEILVQYLNRLDFGGGFHGVHAAADGFFGKEPRELSLEESATLVAIIRGPGQYSPIDQPPACRDRRNLILKELAKAGKLEVSESARLAALPLVTKHKEWAARQKASEELRLAARELRNAGIPTEVLSHGGLTVKLTINSTWDQTTRAITSKHLGFHGRGSGAAPMQVAAIVIDNRTGEIKVFQPGRGDLPEDWNDRATISELPPGSAIKPFVFLLAFANGISPWQMVRNDGISYGELWPGNGWSPNNADDRGSPIAVRDSLIFSQNRGTVRIGADVGLPAFGAFLETLGICDAGNVVGVPSSLIGTENTTVSRITRAFTIFRNDGRICPIPHIVAEVRDADGKILFSSPTESTLVANPAACQMVVDCLGEVFTRGTAKRANRAGRDWIGKTGTTNGARHNWFVGSDDRYTCGVWVGHDRPKIIPGGSGALLALPLWADIMTNRSE